MLLGGSELGRCQPWQLLPLTRMCHTAACRTWWGLHICLLSGPQREPGVCVWHGHAHTGQHWPGAPAHLLQPTLGLSYLLGSPSDLHGSTRKPDTAVPCTVGSTRCPHPTLGDRAVIVSRLPLSDWSRLPSSWHAGACLLLVPRAGWQVGIAEPSCASADGRAGADIEVVKE